MLECYHFTATPILCEIAFWGIQTVQKILILTILEVLNSDLNKFEQLSSFNFTKIQSSESSILQKMTFLDRLNSPKFDITQNRSGVK